MFEEMLRKTRADTKAKAEISKAAILDLENERADGRAGMLSGLVGFWFANCLYDFFRSDLLVITGKMKSSAAIAIGEEEGGAPASAISGQPVFAPQLFK